MYRIVNGFYTPVCCRPGGLRHCGANMNGPGENQQGTRVRKASLLDAKTHLFEALCATRHKEDE